MLKRIKADQLTARKGGDKITASLLTTLLGESQMPGKNDGNRESNDKEVIQVVKKFLKGNKELLKVSQPGTDQEKVALIEKGLLEDYLPIQLNEEGLKLAIDCIVNNIESPTIRDMGKIMKILKIDHEGNYDGKLASTLVKNALASPEDVDVSGSGC